MAHSGRSDDTRDEIVPEHRLALRWKRTVRTLQRWRERGYGPAYLRIGGAVYYRWEDILAFEAAVRIDRAGQP